LAWITWHRRAVRDYDRRTAYYETMICRAMTGRLAWYCRASGVT